MGAIKFLDNAGTFTMEHPENYSGLYFPLAQNMGLKSAITPNLGGDLKVDQNSFVLEPVSIENLNNNRGTRNFWVNVVGEGVWSAAGASAKQEFEKFTDKQDESNITAGFMWQKMERTSKEFGLSASILSFVPLDLHAEVMHVTITNNSNEAKEIVPYGAIPVFGRSADNIRDHRHVTSLLNRAKTDENGVYVKPTLSFDERGHRENELTYFVMGSTGKGVAPESFFTDIETFIGEGGTLTSPRAVMTLADGVKAGYTVDGKETLGGIHFEKTVLEPGKSEEYILLLGVVEDEALLAEILNGLNTTEKINAKLEEVKDFWQKSVNVSYKTGSEDFDGFMKWVSFQPFLRRVFGCSFLPHHDYGRGGRGWRDLWQDCLSLLIMDPGDVRQMIKDNYGGVRIDGTNATIIGEKQGEFVADRNGIARVWMDHGVWPFMTTKLYINQTGDVSILDEKVAYFKDEQAKRGTDLDKSWDAKYGVKLKTASGEIYKGSVMEHIILEQLCSFFEVGAHNHMRLRGADWNDALDMAPENGESVAFTSAYAGNLSDIAELLRTLKKDFGWEKVELLKEIKVLLDTDAAIYDSIDAKHEVLDKYLDSCVHSVSGEYILLDPEELAANLDGKADWIRKHIVNTEWIDGVGEDASYGWFNSYYDNSLNKVEGYFNQGVRMMLTGQVFTIMSNTASDEQVAKICKSADKYLYKKEVGGYRLNTDFKEKKLDLGRMFGFSYGDKENGAVFSHMTVMYANALYRRGFAREGYKALQTLAEGAMNFETSKIYPGVPEYFDGNGRGLYHYLTGAASWYMLTFITEVFGVVGSYGKLTINPKLVKEQFDASGAAKLGLTFAGKKLTITALNAAGKDFGEYKVVNASLDGNKLDVLNGMVVINREILDKLDDSIHSIIVTLD